MSNVRINNLSKVKIKRIDLRRNQTPQEVLLGAYIRRGQLGYKFKRQHSVGPYILDFYCSVKKLAIELDGSQHLENKEYDKERSEYLAVVGIKVIRFWNTEVNATIQEVVQEIIQQLDTGPLHPAKGEVPDRAKGVLNYKA